MTHEYDFLILGAGGTGLAAAMYGARLGLKTLVLGHSHGPELPVGFSKEALLVQKVVWLAFTA